MGSERMCNWKEAARWNEVKLCILKSRFGKPPLVRSYPAVCGSGRDDLKAFFITTRLDPEMKNISFQLLMHEHPSQPKGKFELNFRRGQAINDNNNLTSYELLQCLSS